MHKHVHTQTHICWTLSAGPSIWPTTVPWLVFMTQPRRCRFVAHSAVYLRKNTFCTCKRDTEDAERLQCVRAQLACLYTRA